MRYSLSDLRGDFPAGLVVFLVAIPLCLGIALASEAPLFSGIISGIVGGIVVGALSGSHTSVSGPAAGLTSVVVVSLSQLNGRFDVFLSAIIIAGVLQVILGVIKAGGISNFFPSSVIHGLLASIGIIIIMKQLPHAVGYDKDAEGEYSFFQSDGENTFSELIHMFSFFSEGPVIIFIVSIAILLLWDKTPLKKINIIPAALVTVIVGILLNEWFAGSFPAIAVADEHRVKLPVANTLHEVGSFFVFPNFSELNNPKVWMIGFTIFMVASLETLLNLGATDKLDPQKRTSPPNRELIAQGVGNTISGFLGGLPVTSVIVRSSANINMGNKTKASTIIHGILITVCVLLFPGLLNKIPLACLAAILILTGFKLTKLSLYKAQWKKGLTQFIPFIVTIVAILFTNLLVGVLIGLAFGLFFILRSNFKNPLVSFDEKIYKDETIRLELAEQLSFLNKPALVKTLHAIPPYSRVTVDATKSKFIDYDVLESIKDFSVTIAKEKKLKVNLVGFKDKYELVKDKHQFTNVLTKEIRENLSPAEVLELLKAGNERFTKGENINKTYLDQVSLTSEGQHPMAAVLGCIDSRTTSEIIFDLGLGDVFSVRIAGNVVTNEALGSLEFASTVAGAKVLLVLGHKECGAISAACKGVSPGHIKSIVDKIDPAIRIVKEYFPVHAENALHFENEVAKVNVLNMMKEIVSQSPEIAKLIREGKLILNGGLYDIHTGKVDFYQI